MMNKRTVKVIVPVVIAGLALMVVGGIGLEHTFRAYARVDILVFVFYLLSSALCVGIGTGLCLQSNMIAKISEELRKDS